MALSGLYLDEFAPDPTLCPVEAMKSYVGRTQAIPRPLDAVFLSAKAFFCEISPETIAKDTLFIMKTAGIDISVFKAHSTPAAAASKALDAGATVENVMHWGRWHFYCVFMRIYNCSVR